jgi:hypothetical protein
MSKKKGTAPKKSMDDPQTKARVVSPTKISEGIQRSNSWPDLSSLDGLAYVVRLLTGKTYY